MDSDNIQYKRLDDIKRKIFKGIVQEFNDTHEANISFDDILDMMEAQSMTIHSAFDREKEVKIQHIGRFVINRGQQQILRIAEDLVESEGVSLPQAKSLATKAVSKTMKELKEKDKTLYKEIYKNFKLSNTATNRAKTKAKLTRPLTINLNKHD